MTYTPCSVGALTLSPASGNLFSGALVSSSKSARMLSASGAASPSRGSNINLSRDQGSSALVVPISLCACRELPKHASRGSRRLNGIVPDHSLSLPPRSKGCKERHVVFPADEEDATV